MKLEMNKWTKFKLRNRVQSSKLQFVVFAALRGRKHTLKREL